MTENAITAQGLEALRTELEQLESTGREQIAAQIKTAREWGDLKENAEYHAAKEAQAHLETRILKLREKLVSAEVVEVEDEQTGKTVSYTLVSSHDASPSDGRLSMDSPVAGALRGRRAGDVAVVQTPRGERRFKVKSVS